MTKYKNIHFSFYLGQPSPPFQEYFSKKLIINTLQTHCWTALAGYFGAEQGHLDNNLIFGYLQIYYWTEVRWQKSACLSETDSGAESEHWHERAGGGPGCKPRDATQKAEPPIVQDNSPFNLEPGSGIVPDLCPRTSKVTPAKGGAAKTSSSENAEPWRRIDHGSGREGIFTYPLTTIPFEGFRAEGHTVREALVSE